MSFDPISQDFKLVRFVATVFPDDGHQTHVTNHVELYSLKSDSWEELSDHRCFDCRLTTYVVATVNGVPYWRAQMKNKRMRLLTFDFASKQFSFVDLPDSANRARKLHLAERDGSLAAIIYPGFGKNIFFEVWLRSHDGSWEEVSTICVPGAVEPLGFWTKDELLFKCRGEYLIIFCLDTREAKRLNITSDRKDPYKTFIPCVESGVQLVGKSECENKEVY
ncbi:Unknown protein [Striga hermonthica]|uniref:F-box associated beta-propeller type 1 domain-containing protein n=1 Tax=Striga hermonthica TaxID=68872 RepID=A0A9N7MJE7_STRHE|nr:Unknown protein [Striga hermonthica]